MEEVIHNLHTQCLDLTKYMVEKKLVFQFSIDTNNGFKFILDMTTAQAGKSASGDVCSGTTKDNRKTKSPSNLRRSTERWQKFHTEKSRVEPDPTRGKETEVRALQKAEGEPKDREDNRPGHQEFTACRQCVRCQGRFCQPRESHPESFPEHFPDAAGGHVNASWVPRIMTGEGGCPVNCSDDSHKELWMYQPREYRTYVTLEPGLLWFVHRHRTELHPEGCSVKGEDNWADEYGA